MTFPSLKNRCFLVLAILCLTMPNAFATIYCTHGGSFLKVGMTTSQVRQTCGAPISQEKKKVSSNIQIPVQQLFYKLRRPPPRKMNIHDTVDPETVISFMVSIVGNKVTGVSINNAATTNLSVCPNGSVQINSSLASVINACGSPSYVNNSFKTASTGNTEEKETWVIKPSQYASSLTLLFSNGILQSIQ